MSPRMILAVEKRHHSKIMTYSLINDPPVYYRFECLRHHRQHNDDADKHFYTFSARNETILVNKKKIKNKKYNTYFMRENLQNKNS